MRLRVAPAVIVAPIPALAAALVLLSMLAGCGGSSSGTPASRSTTPSAPASAPGSPASASGSPATSSAPGPSASGPSPSEAGVPIDPTLLGILPTAVAGLAVQPLDDPLSDPNLPANVDRMARALVVDAATGDFAYVSIIALRAGVFSDAFFRSWRDSFDTGACQQAGGVAGNAEATIAGRQTFIGRCAGGVLTYHVRLLVPDLIVSISSSVAAHLGESVLQALQP